jgi:hypothetical protein
VRTSENPERIPAATGRGPKRSARRHSFRCTRHEQVTTKDASIFFFILFINQQSGYNVILLANAVAKESLAVLRVTVGGRAQWLDLVN